MKKISIAIPCYNSSAFIANALRYPVTDDRIDDIVIAEDASNDFAETEAIIKAINCPKIRLISNSKNSGGCYINKAIAASHTKNDWVILLDADNFFDKEYVDAIYNLPEWKQHTIYCPESGMSLPHFTWSDFTKEDIDLKMFQKYITKKNSNINFFKKTFFKLFFSLPKGLKSMISGMMLMKQSSRFLALMNDCNYFLNKQTYLQVHTISTQKGINPFAADTIFVNYNWLKLKNTLKVVPDMHYYHTVHADSYWVKTVDNYEKTVAWIVTDLNK